MAQYPCEWVNDGQGGQIAFPPFITQDELDILARQFTVREDDIFVVTYPRSGTTWTEQIVHLLLNDGRQGEQRLTDAAPWLETLPRRPGGIEAFLKTLTGRRLFTCHLPLALMPDMDSARGRYIYVARNPKDVAVSYYYHDRSKHGFEGSWEDHFTLFMAGKLMFGSYFDHVLPWWQASRQQDNILFLKYEDMKRDLSAAVRQIADFINHPADDELIDRVTAASSFDAMATSTHTNFNWVPQREGVPGHYRKGVVGDWRTHFSPEQSRQLDALYEEKMAGTGLAFDFGVEDR